VSRTTSRYVCQSCGETFLRWEGQCRSCGTWNSLVETVVRDKPRPTSRSAQPATAVPLGLVDDVSTARLRSGIAELDRVAGGGVVPGSIILIGGEPGIGKSTLLLQLAAGMVKGAPDDGSILRSVVYATGEESGAQVRLRADRLGLLAGGAATSVHVVSEAEVGAVVEAARSIRPAVLIVDSVQTVRSDELDGPAGCVGQVREAAARLADMAKSEDVAVILVGHVTKDGSLAGPRTLEHLVDAVLTLEGDRYASLRILRATKNRHGSTDEVGVFEMTERGLVEVADPSGVFIVGHGAHVAGSVVAPTLEGTRPLLVEVQALVSPTHFGMPRRTASGVDYNRLLVLLAVLERRAGLQFSTHDVYASIAGGVTVEEPAADLGLAVAVASSLRDRPVDPRTVVIGEVGLAGEVRLVPHIGQRLAEAARLGFARAVVPRIVPADAPGGLEVVPVSDLSGALRVLV
jgi:DNA repair protein RadA/Sms